MRRELKRMDSAVRAGFKAVKKELNEHLDGINKNTEEIQSSYDYLAELDAKLEKLGERLEQVEMLLNPFVEPLKGVELTKREQEVFAVLYTAQEGLTPRTIAGLIGFSEPMILDYLDNLTAKGVPIVKRYRDGTVYLSLNPRFKELQARKKVLEIEGGPRQVKGLSAFI